MYESFCNYLSNKSNNNKYNEYYLLNYYILCEEVFDSKDKKWRNIINQKKDDSKAESTVNNEFGLLLRKFILNKYLY